MLGAPSYTLAFNTPTTSSLDSYLGFLILNQRKFVVHFRSMVDKIKKKKTLRLEISKLFFSRKDNPGAISLVYSYLHYADHSSTVLYV